MNTYFHGIWRMDWGLGNPNKTAVLIAMIMISIWALAYIWKWGFWIVLTCFIALGVCLIHTVSRGGLLAACAGFAVLIGKLPRPWTTRRFIAVVAGVLLIIISSIYLQTFSRYGQGITDEDPSISNRFRIWESAPRMMVDAPTGWGIGNSGQAYLHWYQPLDHHEKYRTLVNSHLTWLVEFGWPLRFGYVLGWLLILTATFPTKERPWTAIPFGIWIAFFVGSFFSSVAESVWLWIIPIGGLLIALCNRWYSRRWVKPSTWLIPVGLSSLFIVILFIMGSSITEPRIQASQNQIILGKGNPKTWILVDPRIIGPDFGRTLRENVPSYTVGMITGASVPQYLKGDTLIICGTLKKEALQEVNSVADHFQKILIVNPTFYPQELNFASSIPVTAVFGEFSQSSSINDWKARGGRRISILTGIGDFIPKWPLSLLNDK